MRSLFPKFILLVLLPFAGISQKQNNIWYFGNQAGLDFNSGTPVPLTNGVLNTTEGCASIADVNGNLLFYTDGVTVFNGNHVSMPNGTGLFGGNSSSQSAFILPLPGSTTLYYIFTVPDMPSANGFCYSIVDMSLQAGLGDITSKNVLLLNSVTEKLYGTRHQNGTDYWVVVHERNTDGFYAFQFTAAGVNLVPVISHTGMVHNSSIGYLKISADGSWLVNCINQTSEIELFDFDNQTGTVANPITFPTIYTQPYGLEFSPDNSKLYIAEAGNQGGPVDIYQFDLNAGSPAAILASAVSVGSSSNTYLGPLQIGPDCKIYVGRYQTGYLGVIHDPDQPGAACNFVDTGIFLGGQNSLYGLPNQLSVCNAAFGFSGTCEGDSTYFNTPSSVNLLGAQWDFGDPASGINNTAFVINPVHYYASAGSYTVQLIKYYTSFTDTVQLALTIFPKPVVNLGPDTTICAGDTLLLNAGSGNAFYLWQDNSTDSVFSATLPGLYFVTVSQNGCTGTDSIYINSGICSLPNVSFISSDTTFCDKKCLDFTDLSTNNPTSWQWIFPGATPASDSVQNPVNICYNAYGTFDVTLIACNAAGCDTLHVPAFITEFQLPPQPVITQSNDTLYCSPAGSYSWYNTTNPGVVVSTNSYYTTSSGGNYFVIVGDSNGCQNASPVFEAVGIADFKDEETGFLIWPNPAGNNLSVIIHIPCGKSANRVELLDAPGQVVKSWRGCQQAVTFQVQDISSGFYTLRLITGKAVYTGKVILQH